MRNLIENMIGNHSENNKGSIEKPFADFGNREKGFNFIFHPFFLI